MGINWDEFADDGEFPAVQIKFTNPGDKAVGRVDKVRVTDFGGKGERTPELWITQDDGTQVSVAASQVMLRRALAVERPAEGDRVAIVYTGNGTSNKAGQSPPKLFDVKVKRAGEAGPAQPAASPSAQPAAPAPAAQPVTADSLI